MSELWRFDRKPTPIFGKELGDEGPGGTLPEWRAKQIDAACKKYDCDLHAVDECVRTQATLLMKEACKAYEANIQQEALTLLNSLSRIDSQEAFLQFMNQSLAGKPFIAECAFQNFFAHVRDTLHAGMCKGNTFRMALRDCTCLYGCKLGFETGSKWQPCIWLNRTGDFVRVGDSDGNTRYMPTELVYDVQYINYDVDGNTCSKIQIQSSNLTHEYFDGDESGIALPCRHRHEINIIWYKVKDKTFDGKGRAISLTNYMMSQRPSNGVNSTQWYQQQDWHCYLTRWNDYGDDTQPTYDPMWELTAIGPCREGGCYPKPGHIADGGVDVTDADIQEAGERLAGFYKEHGAGFLARYVEKPQKRDALHIAGEQADFTRCVTIWPDKKYEFTRYMQISPAWGSTRRFMKNTLTWAQGLGEPGGKPLIMAYNNMFQQFFCNGNNKAFFIIDRYVKSASKRGPLLAIAQPDRVVVLDMMKDFPYRRQKAMRIMLDFLRKRAVSIAETRYAPKEVGGDGAYLDKMSAETAKAITGAAPADDDGWGAWGRPDAHRLGQWPPEGQAGPSSSKDNICGPVLKRQKSLHPWHVPPDDTV